MRANAIPAAPDAILDHMNTGDTMGDPIDLAALRESVPRNNGRFQKGNLAALKTGLRSVQLVSVPELAVAQRDRADAIAADLGGWSQLSAAKAALVPELARYQMICDSLGHDAVVQMVTRTGRKARREVLDIYDRAVGRQQRLAVAIYGEPLERRQAPAPTLADILTAHGDSPDGDQ